MDEVEKLKERLEELEEANVILQDQNSDLEGLIRGLELDLDDINTMVKTALRKL